MAVAFRAATSQGQSGTTDYTLADPPSGTAADDILVAVLVADIVTPVVTAVPSGWTLVSGPHNDAASDVRVWCYWKRAGASEAGPYVWTLDIAATGGIGCAAFSGADTGASVIDASNGGGTAVGTSHASTSITPTVDNCMIVIVAGADESATFTPYYTPPTDWSEALDVETTGFTQCGIFYFLQGAKAAISGTYTHVDSDGGAHAILAIAPATAAGSTSPRVYAVPFENIASTVQSGLFELAPSTGRIIEIVNLWVTQSSEAGGAAEEMIRVAILRGSTSTGVGGTAVTPVSLDGDNVAAGFTAQTMTTGLGSTASAVLIHAEAFNLRKGWFLTPQPHMVMTCSTAQSRLVIRLQAAPADSVSFTGIAYVRERA